MNNEAIKAINSLSEESKKLFIEYLADAGNWNGQPMWNHNVGSNNQKENGFLTDWKKKGLVSTEVVEGANGIGKDVVIIFSKQVKEIFPEYF